ncbi:hypothetical protein [Symbiobacterium thermophilum]|uniref:Uncharacterized protein n=1 Tax=Symbiobacterium thermophilum TaxID=2734 RepID=A0A953I8F7_SYMTR|nr:hypothetical protein [Symbiobacterium thermophilum]MBY6275501.1 hypothetical protein [Symbiobacterium thermophilum]
MLILDPTQPEPTPRELAARIQELEAQFAWWKRDQEYRDNVLGMFRAWQAVEEHNLTSYTPALMDLYIPPQTKHIQRVILRLRLKPYEAYSTVLGVRDSDEAPTTTALWGEEVDFGVMFSAGEHDHDGTVPSAGGHTHSLKTHRHRIMTPNHTHTPVYAIIHTGTPRNIRIYINGIDRTAELGGPFNDDQESLDITPYVQAIGWNEIRFECGEDPLNDPPRGRIRASVFVELYLP